MTFDLKTYRRKWPRVVDRAETEWARLFAADIFLKLKRDDFQPTPRQLENMEKLLIAYKADTPLEGEEMRGGDGILRRFCRHNGWVVLHE